MAQPEAKVIRVLLFQEGDFWVAQCLEHDIATQSRTRKGVWDALIRTLKAQVSLDVERGRTPLESIPPAPDWYFEAFKVAELDTVERGPEHLPAAFIIQAISEQVIHP
jgi:hypothetical protein